MKCEYKLFYDKATLSFTCFGNEFIYLTFKGSKFVFDHINNTGQFVFKPSYRGFGHSFKFSNDQLLLNGDVLLEIPVSLILKS